ncbi:MAG: acyl-CoA dehydrogenase family protein, partial [Solirubrobacterales bacterium]
AKLRAAEAAGTVAAIAHQVHGAMGVTREHRLQYFTRRLWSWRDEDGNEQLWGHWLGRRVLGRGADALWPSITGSAVKPEGDTTL